jgi:hypothetical protein
MIHLRHAAAAIASGLCRTVLSTHGESGRAGVGPTRNVVAPTSLAGQFEQPYGPMGPPSLFTIPVLRYMKTYGLRLERGVLHLDEFIPLSTKKVSPLRHKALPFM